MWEFRFNLNSIVLSRLIGCLWSDIIGCKVWCLLALAWCFMGYWRFHWKPRKIISSFLFMGHISILRYLHILVFLVLVTVNYSYFFQFFFILLLAINTKIFIKFLFLNCDLCIFLEWTRYYIAKLNNVWFLLQILQSYI